MIGRTSAKRPLAIATLIATLLGGALPGLPGLAPVAYAEAPPLLPNQIGYEVTIESITPHRTRNRTDEDNLPDRDFMSFSLVGVDSAKPLDKTKLPKNGQTPQFAPLWDPQEVDGLYADGVLGDGQTRPGPTDDSGAPIFHLGPVPLDALPDQRLAVAYVISDLAHQDVTQSLEAAHEIGLTVVELLTLAISGGLSDAVGGGFWGKFAGGVYEFIENAVVQWGEGMCRALGCWHQDVNCDGEVAHSARQFTGKELYDLTAQTPDNTYDYIEEILGGVSPKLCGSRASTVIAIHIRRVVGDPPLFNGDPCNEALHPVASPNPIDWEGEWSDNGFQVLNRVDAVVDSKLGLKGRGKQSYLVGLEFDTGAMEHVPRFRMSPHDIGETASGLSTDADLLLRYSANKFATECGLDCIIGFSSLPSGAASAAPSLESASAGQIFQFEWATTLSLPNAVTLAPYRQCSQRYLRYLRYAPDGSILTDAMLSPAQPPLK
jgi:hypothetical protein